MLPAPTPAETLDELDRKIVVALQLNPRASWNQIAREVGSPVSTVARRGNRLLDDGLLQLLVSTRPLAAHRSQSVLMQVTCEPGRIRAVARELAGMPDVRYAGMMTGSFDVLVEFDVASTDDLSALLAEHVSAVPGIRATSTHTVTRFIKIGNEWARSILGPDSARVAPPAAQYPPAAQLDETDAAIVQLLRRNARISSVDLGSALGISDAVARRRLQSLFATGALGLSTYIKPRLLGFGLEAFVWMQVDFDRLEEAAALLRERPEVRYLVALAGRDNLVCELVLTDMDALYRFQVEVLGAVPALRDTQICLELSTLRRSFVAIPPYVDPHVGG